MSPTTGSSGESHDHVDLSHTAPSNEAVAAYLSLPTEGAGPGIVLLYEACDDTPASRELATWYAAMGFAVIAPILDSPPTLDASPEDTAEQATHDACSAAVAHLVAHPSCLGNVCAVGFGRGGALAYWLATRGQLGCAVIYDGTGLETVGPATPPLRCPVLVHLAGQNPQAPDAPAKVRAFLGKNALVRLHEYPDQAPGFCRPDDAMHHAPSAELAALRSLAFLVKYLS